jgi:dolichol kinase
MTTEAAIIAAATLGDGIAPIVGEKFGRHIYRFPWTKRLTIEGSVVGVLLGTVVGCYYYMYMMGLPLLPLRMILTYGTIATVAESSSIAVMDNIIVPVMLHLCIDPVQMWL